MIRSNSHDIVIYVLASGPPKPKTAATELPSGRRALAKMFDPSRTRKFITNSADRLDGHVHDVFAGLNVVLATKGDTHDVYKYTTWEVPVTPVRIGGSRRDIRDRESGHVCTDPGQTAIMQFAGLPDNWVRIGGAAATIVAGAAGLFATNPKTGIYRYDGTPDRWTHVGEAGAMFR